MRKMNFSRVLSCVMLCSILALFYVHQEIEITKTSFLVNEHRHQVSFLLDQYRSLVYNLSRLESPGRIENALSLDEIALHMPRFMGIKGFNAVEPAFDQEPAEPGSKSFLAFLFDRFSTKAEAKDSE